MWSPFSGSFRISPLRLSIYHLPTAGIHCPIYMHRAYLYANYIYSLLPSMLHLLSADALATAVAVPL